MSRRLSVFIAVVATATFAGLGSYVLVSLRVSGRMRYADERVTAADALLDEYRASEERASRLATENSALRESLDRLRSDIDNMRSDAEALNSEAADRATMLQTCERSLAAVMPVQFNECHECFRGYPWGIGPASIRELNGFTDQVPARGTRTVSVGGQYAGKDAALGFKFIDGRLMKVDCILILKHSDRDKYVNDYKVLVSMLTDRYGHPKKKMTQWSSDQLEKDYRDNVGVAVSMGYVSMLTEWANGPTTLTCAMLGDKLFRINIGVSYSSRIFGGS